MAKFEEHCEESIRLFGQPYAEVHRWLDAFAGSPKSMAIGIGRSGITKPASARSSPSSAKWPDRWPDNTSSPT